jgi:toxin YoeB
MAKQIIWSAIAKASKKEILLYWKHRNSSNRFSKHLNQLFENAIVIISEFPSAGKPTRKKDVRIKIVKEYLIFYKVYDDHISILLIWDGRRNPKDLDWLIE